MFDEIRTLTIAILHSNTLQLQSHHFSNFFFFFFCRWTTSQLCLFYINHNHGAEPWSSVNEFILLGLTQNLLKDKVVSVIFLFLYLGTLLTNFLIVMIIQYNQTLQSSMYFFLFYLSFADACFSTTTAPRFIVDSVSEKKAIFFNKYMTQFSAFHFLVLVLLSFDRYVAICKPLRYTAIMSQRVCSILVRLAWMGSCIHASAQILLALKVPFCGRKVTDHYFCDMQPLLKLACGDTYVTNLLIVFNSGNIAWWVSGCCLSPLFSSYVLCITVAQKEERKPFPCVPPTLLSYSLYHAYTYVLTL